jgi:hypothetical protein
LSDNPTPEPEAPEEPTPEGEPTEPTEPEKEPEPDAFDADRAREKIRKLNSESKNLRERAAKAEQQAKENADNGERLTALEAENLRLRIGVKHGLPESLVKRLSGSTEEELLQDAEELMELFKGKTVPSNQPKERLRGGGDPTGEPDPTADSDKFAADMFRR